LSYNYPEQRRPNRTGPTFLLSDTKVDEIINYLSESWKHRILKYDVLHAELELKCSVLTLEQRLKQRGYFRYTACQKPYLTKAQVIARYLWAIAHIFWYTEWLKVLWSDEVTFLIGGRTAKEKVTRKRGERQCETYRSTRREQLDIATRALYYFSTDLARKEPLLNAIISPKFSRHI
jgi:hypothetical protein